MKFNRFTGKRPFPRRESGQGLIELSVAIMVLLIILAGTVDFGRMAFHYIALRDAAQEGASYGSIYPTFCDQIIQRVQTGGSNGLLDPATVQVTVLVNDKECHVAAVSDACASRSVEVKVVEPAFPITMPFIGSFLGGQTIKLEGSVKDTILRPP